MADGNPKKTGAEWFRDAFDADYLNVYAHRDLAEAARAVTALTHLLRLKHDQRLLDLCCGPGRHLVFLRRVVQHSVGLDLSPALLRRAQQHLWATSTARGGERLAHLVRGDMIRLPLAGDSFDRIVNLFTSFGYFQNDADNAAVLAEVARVLRPATATAKAGLFTLDHINRAHLLANMESDSERKLADGSTLEESRAWRPEIKRIEKRVCRRWVGGRASHWTESVRVYEPAELEQMLVDAGMDLRGRHGDYDGRAWHEDSPRLILIASRR